MILESNQQRGRHDTLTLMEQLPSDNVERVGSSLGRPCSKVSPKDTAPAMLSLQHVRMASRHTGLLRCTWHSKAMKGV